MIERPVASSINKYKSRKSDLRSQPDGYGATEVKMRYVYKGCLLARAVQARVMMSDRPFLHQRVPKRLEALPSFPGPVTAFTSDRVLFPCPVPNSLRMSSGQLFRPHRLPGWMSPMPVLPTTLPKFRGWVQVGTKTLLAQRLEGLEPSEPQNPVIQGSVHSLSLGPDALSRPRSSSQRWLMFKKAWLG